MQLFRLFHDVKSIATGLFAIVQYCFSNEEISLALSSFSANSAVVRPGHLNQYDIILFNNTAQHCWCKLLIDIYFKDNPVHMQGHFGYFEQNVFVRSMESQHVGITYDWNKQAVFHVDGIALLPKNIWRGSCQMLGKYRVQAILSADSGQPYETLTLVQHFDSTLRP